MIFLSDKTGQIRNIQIILNNLTDNLVRRSGRLYAIFFLLIIALKWTFFSIPPVWDEAFSIFPAADFLVNHGFDYPLLLAQPRYHEGGPTAHALSFLTLVTALALKLTSGGTMAWLILHILQWLMAAAIGTILTRIYRNLFDAVPAFLLAVITLVYPLMMAQIGAMYVEVPLLFLSLLAFYHYRNERIGLASLFLAAACMTKASGVIAVGALALSALCDHQNKPIGKRFLDAFILVSPAIALVFTLSVIRDNELSIVTAFKCRDILNVIIYRNLSVYQNYISYIPEIIVIYSTSIIISIALLSMSFYRHIKTGHKENKIIRYNCFFLILFSIFHFVVYAYIQASDSHFLPRYLFFVIPSMFLVLYFAIDKILKVTKIKVSLLLIIIGICLINRNGMLYPSIPYSSIAMAERSEEYIDGFLVQKDYISMIEKVVSGNIPIYVSLPDYFLMHYAVSQYVQKPLSNVYFIGNVLKSVQYKFKYPDHFVMVYNYPWLGGAYIKRIMQDISRKKEYSFEVLGYFKKGYFSAYVFEVTKHKTLSP